MRRLGVYSSYLEALSDYVGLLTRNPRYAAVTTAASAEQGAQALQDAGYATDPHYARKLTNMIQSLKEARGFSQQVVLRGKKPDTLWVNKRVVKCPEEVAQQLAVEAGSDVFLLKRIRYVDEETTRKTAPPAACREQRRR